MKKVFSSVIKKKIVTSEKYRLKIFQLMEYLGLFKKERKCH